MQIDMHHAGTYIAARAAGFTHDDADTVAYAAQYVDDATNAGVICFTNSEYMYARIATAHRMIDYQNLIEVINHKVWLPFHFLPGNGGLPAGQEPSGGELEKLVCSEDSHIARDMLRAGLADKGSPRALHRLGITMHVYADTFSHKGFVGAMSEINEVNDLRSDNSGADKKLQEHPLITIIKNALGSVKKAVRALRDGMKWLVTATVVMFKEHKLPTEYIKDISKNAPLGHVTALAYPDLPYLSWHYKNRNGVSIVRDNPTDYMNALDKMTRAMRAWREGDDTMNLEQHEGLGDADRAVIDELLRGLDEPDGYKRHKKWLEAIAAGRFSFGAVEPGYIHKGKGSWKHLALDTEQEKDYGIERYPYTPEFLSSDWKLFHDAAQVHCDVIVHDILPRYGICAA